MFAAPDERLIEERAWFELVKLYRLTCRQAQIAALVCRGLDNKQMQETLHVSEATVRMHLRKVFRKIGVQSRTGLVVELVIRGREIGAADKVQSAGRTSSSERQPRIVAQQRRIPC